MVPRTGRKPRRAVLRVGHVARAAWLARVHRVRRTSTMASRKHAVSAARKRKFHHVRRHQIRKHHRRFFGRMKSQIKRHIMRQTRRTNHSHATRHRRHRR